PAGRRRRGGRRPRWRWRATAGAVVHDARRGCLGACPWQSPEGGSGGCFVPDRIPAWTRRSYGIAPDIGFVRRDVEELKRWQEEVKKRGEEWGRKLWLVVPPILAAALTGLINYLIHK